MSCVISKRFLLQTLLTLSCAVTSFTARSAFANDEPPPPPPPASLAPETAAPNPPLSPNGGALKAPESPEPSTPEVTAARPPAQDTQEDRAKNIITARHQGRIPYYQMTRPAWAVEFSASAGAFGGNNIEASQSQAGTSALAFELQTEYQPPFFQGLGVLGFGPSIAAYPITPGDTVTNLPVSIWSAGGQVRYQARYFREQVIVPTLGFEAQYLTYHFKDSHIGGTSLTGPFIGAMLLLNVIEPSAASELYIEQGISRSYLVAEYKSLAGGDGTVTVSGSSFFFGLRLEF